MRERWFFVHAARRRGPFSLEQLIEAVASAPDPGSVLVWTKGLRGWTRADSVTRLEGRLAGPRPDERPDASGPGRGEVAAAEPPRRADGRRWALAAVGVGVLAVAAVSWLTRPRTRPPAGVVPIGAAGHEDAPAVVVASAPATMPASRPAAGPLAARAAASASPPPLAASARVGETEADLPRSELGKLRGVAAWSGEALRLTVYNGSDWRVTELRVRIERLAGEDFVEDTQPLALRPPQAAVDAGVADLLRRVAPDRRKPGLNALDTGVFEGQAGATPEGFRWRIESGRGYPPLR